nr:MFS transporter [uncultured Aminipila sp.]
MKEHFKIIYLINLLLDAQMFIIEPVFAVYLTTRLGFSVTSSSFIIAGSFVGSIIGCFAVPVLVKKFHYKSIMGVNIIIVGLAAFLLTTTHSLLLLALFNGSMGLGYSIINSNIQSIISKVFPEELIQEAFAKRAVASNIGISVGVLLSGVLNGEGLIKWCFLVPALLSIISFVLIFIFVVNMEDEEVPEYISISTVVKRTFSNIRLQIFNFISFGFWIALSAFLLGLPLFVNASYPNINIGLVYFVNTITIVLLQVKFIKFISEKMSILMAITAGSVVITVSFLTFFSATNLFLLFLAVIVFTIGEVMVLPLIPSFIAGLSSRDDTDINISYMMLVRYIGLAVGQIVAGVLIDYTSALNKSPRFSWFLFAIIAGIVSICFYVYSCKNKELREKQGLDLASNE